MPSRGPSDQRMQLTERAQPAPAPILAPTGIRIASTLTWVVGVVTLLAAVAIGIPSLSGPEATVWPLLLNSAVGVAVCAAAFLVRRQKRIGVLVLVLAWATPTVVAVAQHQSPQGGPLLIIVALLLVGANWKHLR
jgi:hypothetical protein